MSSYVINTSEGTFTISANQINTTATSIALPGRNSVNWGQPVVQGLVNVLENFADTTGPSNPLPGQFWYRTDLKQAYARDPNNNWQRMLTRINANDSGAGADSSQASVGNNHQYIVDGDIVPRDVQDIDIGTDNRPIRNIRSNFQVINDRIQVGDASTSGNVSAFGNDTELEIHNVIRVNELVFADDSQNTTAGRLNSSIIPQLDGNDDPNLDLPQHDLGTPDRPFLNIYVNNTNIEELNSDYLTVNEEVRTDLIPDGDQVHNVGSETGNRWDGIFANRADFSTLVESPQINISDVLNVEEGVVNFTGPTNNIIFDDGELSSDIIPSVNNTYDIGSSSNRLSIAYAVEFNVRDDITPASNNSADIGTTSLRFQNVYLTNLDVNDTETNNVTVGNELTMSSGSVMLPSLDEDVNLGSSTNKFNTVYAVTFEGTATSAEYADLAERFEADDQYDPGTLVVIGGEKEITITEPNEQEVFGVVTTNPAYLMNASVGDDKSHPGIALIGRVPVKVVGEVNKGDFLIASDIKGYAIAVSSRKVAVETNQIPFGRALENKSDNDSGTILAFVGV